MISTVSSVFSFLEGLQRVEGGDSVPGQGGRTKSRNPLTLTLNGRDSAITVKVLSYQLHHKREHVLHNMSAVRAGREGEKWRQRRRDRKTQR